MTTLIRLPEVLQRTALTRSKLYQLMDEQAFPKPVKLGGRVNAWSDQQIEEWINERLAEI